MVEWETIPTHPNYEASRCGMVRRVGGRDLPGKGEPIAGTVNRVTGYRNVALISPVTGKRRSYGVHQLVALAFIGLCPEGQQVNHIDGIKDHNHASNLEYVTCQENIRHAHRLGLSPRGERHKLAKITDIQAKTLVSEYIPGVVTYASLGEKYGISLQRARAIVKAAR